MLEGSTSVHAEAAWDIGSVIAATPRRFLSDATTMLRCIIEHVDYGLALISIGSRRLHLANSAALLAMSSDSNHSSGLSVVAGELCALTPVGERALERSLTLARTGVRDLLTANKGPGRTTVAVVPLAGPEEDGQALLIFSKPRLCDATTLALFARSCDLTAAESNVLAAVCEGKRPHEVARQHGVQVSTVRSQLLSIRQKTRSGSIRELVQTVSLLPPMARHLA